MKVTDLARLGWRLGASLRSQHWSAPRIAAWQSARLVAMMRHAAARVPFYREHVRWSGAIDTVGDLERFPVLTKADIQAAGRSLLADDVDPARLPQSRTSGSTGQPTTTWFDPDAWLTSKYVLKLRRLIVHSGLAPGQRVLIVSESDPGALADIGRAAPSGGPLYRQRFVSIHTPIEAHVELICRWRPTALYAYPSYLAELVEAARRLGAQLPAIPVVYTSSEVLTSGLRARLERALQARICDIYGSTEFKEVAWQCEAGRYHLNIESVFLEPLPASGSAPLVLSTLINRAMPLLRFRIGDEGEAAAGACACGRESPGLVGIQGRAGDHITLPSGRQVSPYLLTTAIEQDAALLQYRVVETRSGHFRVELVAQSEAARDDVALCAQLRNLCGGEGKFEIARLPALPRAGSGKRSVFLREPVDLAC